MKNRFILCATILVPLLTPQFARAVSCTHALTHLEIAHTESYISYLAELYRQGIISSSDLQSLTLENMNPVSAEQSATNVAAAVHRAAIEELIREHHFSAEKVLEWAREKLSEVLVLRQHKVRLEKRTQESFREIHFIGIPPGEFQMGERTLQNRVVLTNAFEAMDTPVTQKMWARLMYFNPAKFSSGENGVIVKINGHKTMMQADHPVEQISWWSAVYFANVLSAKSGFLPAYDLSGIDFVDSREAIQNNGRPRVLAQNEVFGVAARGTLSIARHSAPKLPGFFGNVYKAEGYRLPTEAEQEYLLRAAGKGTGYFHFGDDSNLLTEYAWYYRNSFDSTQPVALKLPIVIDGNSIFDMNGNVTEWSHDSYTGWKQVRKPITNPQYNNAKFNRIIRGGSWNSGAGSLHSAIRQSNGTGSISDYIGFRLVRTLK